MKLSDLYACGTGNLPSIRLFMILLYLPKVNSQTAPACRTRIRGIPTVKYQCLVLWRKTYMPAQVPILPPTMAAKNRVFSEIRHFLCFAFHLSSPIRKNPARFTKARYITGMYSIPGICTPLSLCICFVFSCSLILKFSLRMPQNEVYIPYRRPPAA